MAEALRAVHEAGIAGGLFGAAWAFIPAILQAKRGSHIVSTTIIAFFGFIILVAGLFTLVGRQIYSGMPDLVTQVMAGFSSISDWLSQNPFGIDSRTISGYINDGIESATQFLQSNSSELLGGALLQLGGDRHLG